MSNIRLEKGSNLHAYRLILQETIKDIESKIGIIDNEIEWIIFDEKSYLEEQFKNMPSFIYQNNYKYGFCYVKEKQIWISTATIMTSRPSHFYNLEKKLPKIFNKQDEHGILLVNVILDELAHISTKKDHGNKEYESKLKNYYDAYYYGKDKINALERLMKK